MFFFLLKIVISASNVLEMLTVFDSSPSKFMGQSMNQQLMSAAKFSQIDGGATFMSHI